jgi:two-component system, OmpR family, response regulator
LRRVQPLETANASTKITVGALCIWPAQRLVEWGSQPVMLTSSEYSLLEVLAKNAGQIVSKQDLSQQALGRPLVRFDRSIDVHLSSIRHKLGLLPDGRHCIQTVFRSGYQLLKS